MDLNSVDATTAGLETPGFINKVFRDGDFTTIRQKAPSIRFASDLAYNEAESEEQFWTMALSDKEKHFFADSKKFAFGIRGTYQVNGKNYQCGPKECIGFYDIGRGAFTYNTAWYWANLVFYLPDGRRFGLNFGDGIGVNREKNDKAMEDFVIIEGKHYKLDQTESCFDNYNFKKEHAFQTVADRKYFPNRKCSVTFTPIGNARDGYHLFYLGFVQNLVFGYYNGECEIEGEKIVIENRLGAVEQVRARW